MTTYKLIISLIILIVWPANCVSDNKKRETIRRLHRTGVPIAVDSLIQKYEREHQQMYEKAINNGDHLDWPDLDSKYLSDYCKKYLHRILPCRNFDGTTGIKIQRLLHYENTSTTIHNKVVIVQCKATYKSHLDSYYMTRAFYPNCVYALKSTGSRNKFILNIINKHCDFEDRTLTNRSLKRKRKENIGRKHQYTGQPIANDKYLLELELEHQELLKREGHNGKRIEWLYAKLHQNLDAYCFQYIQVCAPRRRIDGVKGKWRFQKLHYKKLITNYDIQVTTVICHTNVAADVYYYMTRAPEKNCVYALIRQGSITVPFMIVFKHCDFEEPNQQQTIPLSYNVQNKIVIPKSEVKEETFDSLLTLQFFQYD